MYESALQESVSGAIVEQEVRDFKADLTKNELAVLVEVNGTEAAYTADEARELARAMQVTSDQRWSQSADETVEYLNLLADIVDGEQEREIIDDYPVKTKLNP